MLGGEVGRMRRETWAKDLHAGAKSDRKLAAALREVDTAEPKAAQVDALLRAFFVDDGAGDAKGTETREHRHESGGPTYSVVAHRIAPRAGIASSICASAGAARWRSSAAAPCS